jgi:tRNA(fMet)-specific endonuclease VapC
MLQYMLDTNICIYVIKSHPVELREQFNRLTEQICISTITLAELYYGVEKSSRHAQNLRAV